MVNLNITILPILVFLLLVSVLLMIISRGKNWWRRKTSVKEKPFFFKLYSGILLVLTLAYILFPNSITTETLKEYDGEFNGVHQLGSVHLGKVSIDKIANFKQTNQTYPLEGSTLRFKDTGDDYFYDTVNVLIVKEPSLQNEYCVETYQTPQLLDGKDMTLCRCNCNKRGS